MSSTARRFEKAYAVALMTTDEKQRALMQIRFGLIRNQTDHLKEQAIVEINKLLCRDHTNSACDENIKLKDFVKFFAVKAKSTDSLRRGIVYWLEDSGQFLHLNIYGGRFTISMDLAEQDDHLVKYLSTINFRSPVRAIDFKKFAGL